MNLITDAILVVFYGVLLLLLHNFKTSTNKRLTSLENKINELNDITDEWKKKLIDALTS